MAFAGTVKDVASDGGVNLGRIDPTTGSQKIVFAIKDITLDSSYDSGGELVTAAMLGMTTVFAAFAVGGSGTTPGAYFYEYAPGDGSTTSLLKVYWGDNANAGAAKAVEVTAATNLSAVTVRLLVIGIPAH